MLETPRIRQYSFTVIAVSSDNLIGADNQQERLDAYSIENPQRPYAEHRLSGGEDMVRSAWRHAEPGRNDLAHGQEVRPSVTEMSVPIRCSRRKSEEGCP